MSGDPIGGLGARAPLPPVPFLSDRTRLEAMPAAEAAREVEGLFASMLLSEMKKSLDAKSLFGSAPGADVYDGLFEQMFGQELANQGGLGIQSLISAQLSEKSQADASKADHSLSGTPPAALPEIRS